MRKEDILALGYREVDHGGFCWLANDQGKRFVMEVDDWSFQGLATRNGWKRWKRAYHTVHLGCDKQGITYLIKNYPPKKYEARPFARRTNRARKEFLNTLIVFKEHIQTVVPIALGEDKESGRQGIIIYPFLDQAVTLARLYVHKEVKGISVRDRHFLEKTVGRMVQRITARGIFPRDLGIDHFLAERDTGGQLSVHWVDLERVKFISLFKKRIGMRSLGKILAQMEWLRVSGYKINRCSMMRVGRAYFQEQGLARLDKRLCRLVIQKAREAWYQRRFHLRKPGPGVIFRANE